MTEPRLLLVAASRLGHAVARSPESLGQHVVGFLDDDVALRGTQVGGLPVLGGLDAVSDHPGNQVVICAGRGAARERILARLSSAGVSADRFETIVDPAARLARDTQVGPGSIVLAGVVATTEVTIGAHVVVMPNAVLTHDCVLGDFATVCAGVALGGGVRVGRGAFLGMLSAVRERLDVGPFATLGMGAALVTNLPPGRTWVGVPARERGRDLEPTSSAVGGRAAEGER